MENPSPIKLIVYPVGDLVAAKKIFGAYLGVEPYVDGAYYVGYRVGDLEIGLDPNGPPAGPIGYVDVADIHDSLAALVDAGAEVHQEVRNAGGVLVASVNDGAGNLLGLRQPG